MTRTIEAALASNQNTEAARGLAYGLAAYGFWGIVPVYFKLIAHVPAHTVLAHRITWSILFLLLVLAVRKRWDEVIACVRHRRTLLLLLASTVAIAVNWFTFVWAVGHKDLIGASLGYFMNPLFTVMLGMVVLGERLRVAQWIALLLAIGAVAAMLIAEGRVPVVPLALATSFSLYGLLRKQAVVAPLVGLFIETLLLLPPALVVVALQIKDANTDPRTYVLLSLLGVVTAMPLIWFAAAARRLRLTTMGFLQYLSPTGQFLLGRFAYHEPFSSTKLTCFSVVWFALAIFTIDSVRAYRQNRSVAVPVMEPD